jgi:hypothetical protein
MKYFITLLIAALSLNAFSQGIPQLPYNPDENGDGLIGVPDLQALLAQYGLEFNSAVLSEDAQSAIVYMGDSDIFSCRLSCSILPGNWWLMTMNEAGLVVEDLESIAEGEEVWIENIYSTNNYPLGILRINGGDGLIMTTTNRTMAENRCYCATRELPKVEYKHCTNMPESTLNSWASQGWRLIDATAVSNSGYLFGVMWRWAE